MSLTVNGFGSSIAQQVYIACTSNLPLQAEQGRMQSIP